MKARRERSDRRLMSAANHDDLIEQIDRLVAEEIAKNPVSYNVERPYQTYERIGYIGRRWSVERRIAEYGIDELYSASSDVLDIGSNFGFFTVESALRCRTADGIEPSQILSQIGRITAERLGAADRVRFFDCTFEEFESDLQYDLVLSMSSFYTQDGRQRGGADDYFSKVLRLLGKGGGYSSSQPHIQKILQCLT